MKHVKKELEKLHDQIHELLKTLRDNASLKKKRTVRYDLVKNMVKVFFHLLKGLASMKPIALMVWGAFALVGIPEIVNIFWKQIPSEIFPWLYGAGVFVLFLALLSYITINKMKDPSEEVFHIDAYKKRKEYLVFSPYIDDKNFSFKDLANELKDTFTKDEYLKEVSRWSDITTSLAETLTDTEAREKEKSRIIENKDSQYLFLRDLLEKFREKVRMSVNSDLKINDLKFFYPYSVYRLVDNELILDTEIEVREKLLEKIDIENPEPSIQDMACVKVVKDNESYYSIDAKTLSYFIEFRNSEIWVFNLHIGQSQDGRDMLDTLLSHHDIIDVELLEKRNFYKMNIEALFDVLNLTCSLVTPLAVKGEWR